jgi:hypothetical protein
MCLTGVWLEWQPVELQQFWLHHMLWLLPVSAQQVWRLGVWPPGRCLGLEERFQHGLLLSSQRCGGLGYGGGATVATLGGSATLLAAAETLGCVKTVCCRCDADPDCHCDSAPIKKTRVASRMKT